MTTLPTLEAPPTDHDIESLEELIVETAGRELASDTMIEIVVPVYNEEVDLGESIRRLDRFVATAFSYSTRITIADNASTDRTWILASQLAAELPRVRAVRMQRKGRGRALNAVWSASPARVLAYMDVDLSTDLRALLPLVAPLISGHSDLAIGSRLTRSSRVVRGPKREFISRSYNVLLKGALQVSFSDAQCGFKAISGSAARRLLPLVEDGNWFFDTELLVLAQRAGFRIYEVPVDWVDDPATTVDIVATATEDVRGVVRLMRGLLSGRIPVAQISAEVSPKRPDAAVFPGVPRGLVGQIFRFGGVGVLSTVAYYVLFLLLRDVTGAQLANLTALVITAVANTATNRRFTFGLQGRDRLVQHHVGGLIAFGVGLALTSGSLLALHALAPGAPRWAELSLLLVANAVATGVRFLSLRQLMTHRTAGLKS